jgi:hypothetical protein
VCEQWKNQPWAGKTERVSFNGLFCGSTNPRMTELSHFWDWFMTDWIALQNHTGEKETFFKTNNVGFFNLQPKVNTNLEDHTAIPVVVHDRYVFASHNRGFTFLPYVIEMKM